MNGGGFGIAPSGNGPCGDGDPVLRRYQFFSSALTRSPGPRWLWGSRTRSRPLICGFRLRRVRIQSSEDRSPPDLRLTDVRSGVSVWREESQCSMWSAMVEVGAVSGQDCLSTALAEDQDAVGELGPGDEDEAFGRGTG